MRLLTLVLFTLAQIGEICTMIDFKGGYVTWRWVSGLTVEFHTAVAGVWGDVNDCQPSKYGQLLGPARGNWDEWECWGGCTGNMHDLTQTCVKASQSQDFEIGEHRWNYTFPSDTFVMTVAGWDWIKLSHKSGACRFRLTNWGDIRERSDTRRPNSSPTLMVDPVYQKEFGCQHKITIPVLDLDFDNVRCRWSSGQECGCICNGLPNAHLDEETCVLTFNAISANGYKAGGNYGVTITVEDMPRDWVILGNQTRETTKMALSMNTVQFTVHTPQLTTKCTEKPQFVSPTPDEGQIFRVKAGDKIEFEMYADNAGQTGLTIDEIHVRAPSKMNVGSLLNDPNRSNTKYRKLSWKTTIHDEGVEIVCAQPFDNNERPGDLRCFKLIIEHDHCDSQPCQNGGFCRETTNDFICICEAQYSGKDCSTFTTLG